MLTFTSLASSSAGCCYRLRSGSAALLIECGIPFPRIQRGCDYQTSALDGCLVSHHHKDHSLASRELLRRGVNVYAHPEAWPHMERSGTNDCERTCAPLQEFRVGSWDVLPFEAVHDAPGCLGFVIGHEGGKLLYLTDSAYCKHRFSGLTHIAIECNFSSELIRENTVSGAIDRSRFDRTVQTHMSLENALSMLAANDLSAVREIHLLHLSPTNSDARVFKAAVAAATGVPICIAGEK